MAIREALTREEFNHHIDTQLDQHRVDRYQPGAPWLDEVVDDIDSSHISDEELRRLYIGKVVREREREATRSVTNLAKKMAKTGQMPLEWFEYANRPIAYTLEVPDENGDLKKQEFRVALRAATGEDFLAWARWREKEAKRTYDTEMKTVDVFRGWAHEMETGGFRHFLEYAQHVTGGNFDD